MTVAVVIPTLAASPVLDRAVAALLDQSLAIELVLVHQGPRPLDPEIARRVDRVVRTDERLGFATAVNRGIETVESRYVAVVNDDAVVAPDWLGHLVERLDAAPALAAVQGLHLRSTEPERIDGAGLGWNRWWQAVQIGRGERLDSIGESTLIDREVFGVSATAAVYRRRALRSATTRHGVFDERLDTYYEDVELATRLRAGGYRCASVPAATVEHVGGASSEVLGHRRLTLLYGNRLLVVARLLGGSFWPHLPRIVFRDKLDAVLHPSRLPGIVAGWSRAMRRLPRFARSGSPLLPLSELERFRPSR